MIEPEEARLIFSKWREECSVLKIVALGLSSGYFCFNGCFVRGFSPDTVALDITGGHGVAEFDLRGFAFEYAAPPEGQGEGTVSAVLAVRGTERIFFMELDLTDKDD